MPDASQLARDQRRLSMLAMINDGVSLREIGERFGVSRERVRQITHWRAHERSGTLRQAELVRTGSTLVVRVEFENVPRLSVGRALDLARIDPGDDQLGELCDSTLRVGGHFICGAAPPIEIYLSHTLGRGAELIQVER